MNRRATSRDLSRFKAQPWFPVGEDDDASLVGFASRNPWLGHPSAWMQSAGTSTSVTPRKENKSFTRYLGGLFRRLFHNVANSVSDRSLEHYTLGLQASKVHTHEFGRVGT